MKELKGWDYINALEEKYQKGGYILSEYVTKLVQSCDLAFCVEANIAVIITATSAIETYLKSEYFIKGKVNAYDAIEISDFSLEIKKRLHELRKYRNSWVHVNEPWNDSALLENSDQDDAEIELWARKSLELLRIVIYDNPWV